ncbi:ArnT family glycosyltransferase [Bifidobacterium dentium]|uniref:ArnT family glycosyltransferase n=1 Tax=Bifidobacterium dentium TaxID=1689 RepID=UPI001FD7C829|nr:hypothetical protein [Bifidobacterium dentium]
MELESEREPSSHVRSWKKNHHCWHTSQDATLSHIGEHMTFTKVSALTPHKRMLVCALANACIAVMAVLLLDVFSPLYPANLRLMPDQDFFQLVGRVWAEGGVPYRDIWDQKGPFIFFVNMLGWKLTGNGYGIVIIECVFILATMWLLWLIIGTVNGHEHHPDNRKPIYSYIISMLVLWICVLWIAICLPGSWNMTELFCLPFLAASAWLLLRSLFAYQGHPTGQGAWRVPSSWAYVHGLAFGVCFMTRLSNAVGVCVGLLVLTALLIIRRLWSNLGICILGFLSGVATFFIPFAVYFAAHDVFYEFMYGTILYNLHYAGGLAAAGIPNLSTLVLVFAVPFAMLLAGIIRLIRHASITCYSIFLVLCAMMFAALFFKMFTIQTGSYLHYTVIDVVFLPSVLVPAAAFLRNKVSRIVALVCVTAALLGYAGMRTYQVTTWSEFDNTWVAQLVKQSHGSIAFYNMNAMAYTLNDVKPAYPYAVFQDWQAEFSDDLRATIIDSYARPRTEMLVVQQYGTLTPIIADILDTKYQFVRSVTDASGTYDIYRCRYSV